MSNSPTSHPRSSTISTDTHRDPPWWKKGVIYQIYPRSFQDLSADGIGDLGGIKHRLDYLQELGVTAIWISPFFRSPMKDFGYDVEDHRDVDPIFGTLDDFDSLIEQAHRRNIRVLIDLVLSHTAETHPWFIDALQNKNSVTGVGLIGPVCDGRWLGIEISKCYTSGTPSLHFKIPS